MDIVTPTERGLYCEAGDFYVDPWLPVESAILTHGHADHARPVAERAIAARPSARILARRIPATQVQALGYGESVTIKGARVSLHPAGHVLGSAQVRVEVRGEVAVISGDYKLALDPTCEPFEPIRCRAFYTEATFGLPIFRWASEESVLAEIDAWRAQCADEGRVPVLFSYALGKSQRLLSLMRDRGPFVVHGAIQSMIDAYREAGVRLPETILATSVKKLPEGALVLAPLSAQGTPWMRRFHPASLAFASGWMRVRGVRRRRALDRGFVLSDHADWPALLSAIEATRAERVIVTHGSQRALARYLRESAAIDAAVIETAFAGEQGAEEDTSGEGAPRGAHA